jgi:hypothetical protein
MPVRVRASNLPDDRRGITTVTIIRRAGMLRQHPRGKNSRNDVIPERAMSSAKQSPPPRNRSLEPTRVSSDREADRDPSGQSGQSQIALVWSREPVAPSRTSAAMTRLTVAAAARISGYGGSDVLHIVLAILSWIIWEFLHGCAAYAHAMYPPIDALDHELEAAESQTADPVVPAPPGENTTIAAGKPRLTIAASNERSVKKPRSRRR